MHGEGRNPGSSERETEATVRNPSPDPIPSNIGPYRILEEIGQGGFGVVYLAERREPMVQRVALKVIKPGMDSRTVIARFEQERQALAVMDHPNVARVFDGGITEAGLPYFVMEHVQGEPITTFCDRHVYTIQQRLELFIPVCEAVQHAHHKGIIHRDLKPSNILVSIKDGSAIPKVIDFGVAKAISHLLTDKTIFTETGQLIGTPEYMSPEQAEMGRLDVDTRTDVYSLGVVLYELLSGLLPFDSKELRSRGYAEIQRIIREEEPPRPSTRLSTCDDETGAAIAKARHTNRERISGELKRELEWIPLKAMRKDRTRRYASAEAFSADLRRYLEGRPVEAAPESRVYRFKKFLVRRKGPVAAALVIAASLIAATGVSLWQRGRAVGSAYEANIAAAAAMLALDDAHGAGERLKLCPESRRDWEWAHLRHAADGSLYSLELNEPGIAARVARGGVCVLSAYQARRASAELTPTTSWRFRPDDFKPSPYGIAAAISSDGQRVLLVSPRDGSPARAFVTSPPGNDFVPVESMPEGLRWHPRLSPRMSGDGKVFAFPVTRDGTEEVLVCGDGARPPIPVQGAEALALSEDGGAVALAHVAANKTAICRVWLGSESLELQGTEPVGPGPMLSVVAAPRAAIVAACAASGITVWDRGDAAHPRTIHIRGGAQRLALSEDGRWLAAADGPMLRIHDLSTGGLSRLRGNRYAIVSIAFSADARTVFTITEQGNVRSWGVGADTIPSGLLTIAGASASEDGRYVLAFSPEAVGAAVMFDTVGRAVTRLADPAIGRILTGAISADGSRIIIATDQSVSVWNLRPLTLVQKWLWEEAGMPAPHPVPEQPRNWVGFAPGPGAQIIVAPQSGDQYAQAFALTVGQLAARSLGRSDVPLSATVSTPSGRSVVLGWNMSLRLLGPDVTQAPRQIGGMTHPAAISFNESGDTMAVIGMPGNVYLVPAAGPKFESFAMGHPGGGRAVTWMGSRFATGADDGAVMVWSADPLRSLMAERVGAPVVGLAFERQSQTLWAATADGSFRALSALR